MAFKDYIHLIVPAVKALGKFIGALNRAKDDDGKISVEETFNAFAGLIEDMWPFIEPIIKDE